MKKEKEYLPAPQVKVGQRDDGAEVNPRLFFKSLFQGRDKGRSGVNNMMVFETIAHFAPKRFFQAFPSYSRTQ